MTDILELGPEALCRRCNPEQFAFATTAELEDLAEVVGQQRAQEAVHFGIGMHQQGYNIFALGPSGIGRHTLVRQFVEQQAAKESPPDDWCYINNFDDPPRPQALRLPPGRGTHLRQAMNHLVEDLLVAIPAAFETEEYQNRLQEIEDGLKSRQEEAFSALHDEAEKQSVSLLRTPGGFAFAPTRDGEIIPPDDYEKLPEKERARIEEVVSNMQQRLQQLLHQIPLWGKETREQAKSLNREVTRSEVSHLIDALRNVYGDLPEVLDYLRRLEEDIIDNADLFRQQGEHAERRSSALQPGGSAFNRYRLNLLIDHGDNHGAPIVYCDNPTYQNLIGRVEHIAQMGALITDFTLIKPGMLHRANGGYLILDAHKVLMEPYAWAGLKRALRARKVQIESLGQMLSLISTVSLEPEAIPLEIKVILIGERTLYYLLQEYDPEFAELFKVAADFEESLEAESDNLHLYARLLATQARQLKLRPLDRSAVARVVEFSAREAGDGAKLSTHARTTTDLLREADHWAAAGGRDTIGAADVQQAIDAKIGRADRIRSRLYEEIAHGVLMIDTEGEAVAQVNGLSVVQPGDFAFGQPTRITATARVGEGQVLDIQREVELAGPIHSKGVMILSAFLGARYAPEHPPSLSASLVFEQTYGEVEGDSASVGELCALLSAIAGVPIRQSLAVTGSINQHGQVQAIGGVNEKIEGFFDVCNARGLSGEQGVLIPMSNVRHLMLRDDVVEAVAAGRFHVYAVSSIDEAASLLTGLDAGVRGDDGQFPEGSLNRLVEERLSELAVVRAIYGEQVKARAGLGDGPAGEKTSDE